MEQCLQNLHDSGLQAAVCQKPEALDETSDSLPQTFARKADWIKRSTSWHTVASNATKTNAGKTGKTED